MIRKYPNYNWENSNRDRIKEIIELRSTKFVEYLSQLIESFNKTIDRNYDKNNVMNSNFKSLLSDILYRINEFNIGIGDDLGRIEKMVKVDKNDFETNIVNIIYGGMENEQKK